MLNILYTLLDWVANLLPGHRSDPASFEARVRDAVSSQSAMIERAIVKYGAEIDAVQTEAKQRVENIRSLIETSAAELSALSQAEGVLPPNEVAKAEKLRAGVVKGLDAIQPK